MRDRREGWDGMGGGSCVDIGRISAMDEVGWQGKGRERINVDHRLLQQDIGYQHSIYRPAILYPQRRERHVEGSDIYIHKMDPSPLQETSRQTTRTKCSLLSFLQIYKDTVDVNASLNPPQENECSLVGLAERSALLVMLRTQKKRKEKTSEVLRSRLQTSAKTPAASIEPLRLAPRFVRLRP